MPDEDVKARKLDQFQPQAYNMCLWEGHNIQNLHADSWLTPRAICIKCGLTSEQINEITVKELQKEGVLEKEDGED